MIIGPYTIDGGEIAPYETYDHTDQTVDIDGDGHVVIHDPAYIEQYFTAKFRCTKDMCDNIRGFLIYGMNFRGRSFTFVDPFGVSWTVRFWGNRIERKFIAPDLYEMELLLRVEVP